MALAGLPFVPEHTQILKRSRRNLDERLEVAMDSVFAGLPGLPKGGCSDSNGLPCVPMDAHDGEECLASPRKVCVSLQPWISPYDVSQDAQVLAWLSNTNPRWVNAVRRLLAYRIPRLRWMTGWHRIAVPGCCERQCRTDSPFRLPSETV